MNEIVANAQTFLETLQNASGDEVKQWDAEALQRALQWARYFEELHRKLLDRPKKIQQVNRGLHLIGHLPGAAVSQSEITFDSLGQSVRLLLQALLQNPHLSSDLYREVIKQYTLLDADTCMTIDGGGQSTSQHQGIADGEDQRNKLLVQDVSRFAKAKATRLHLLEMRTKLTQSLKDELNIEGKSVQQVAMETDASLLRDHLMHHLTDSQSPEKTREYLIQHLHCVAKLPNGMETIKSLCTLPGVGIAETEKEYVTRRQCEHFVSQWISENQGQYTYDDDGTDWC